MGVTIREKPAGSGEYYVFVNHAGKRMSKKIGKDKRLAKEVAAKIQAKLILGDTGLLDEKSEKKNIPTLQKYVHGWKDATGKFQTGWLDKLKLSVKRSTRLGYQTLLKVHVLPEFGNLPLDEITPRLINNFILKKSQDGYMINTVAGIKNCLSAVLRDAVKPDEFISSNPARGISIPRPENVKIRKRAASVFMVGKGNFRTMLEKILSAPLSHDFNGAAYRFEGRGTARASMGRYRFPCKNSSREPGRFQGPDNHAKEPGREKSGQND